MNIDIIKADHELALDANDLLTKLIVDEKKYDKNINENCVVKSLYENFFDNKDVCLLIAKKSKKIVGYIYGYIQNNGDSKIKKVGVLDALYVEEEFRNNGVAQSLIEGFKRWAKSNRLSYLELKVCKDNLRAIKLYEKMGFKTSKIIMEDKLGDYDDAI